MALRGGTAGVTVEIGPLRAAFLVRHDSADEVLDAVRLNTWLWGGVRNPIVPVTEDDGLSEFSWQVLGRHDPDLIYWFTEPPSTLVRDLDRAFKPLRAGPAPTAGPDLRSVEVAIASHALGVDPPTPEDATHLCVLSSDLSDHGVTTVLACELGMVEDGDVPAVPYRLGQRSLAQTGSSIAEYIRVLEEATHTRPLLSTTEASLEVRITGPSFIRRTVVCGTPHDTGGLCQFWNLRTMEPRKWPRGEPSRVVFLPVGPETAGTQLPEFLEWVRRDLCSESGAFRSTPEVVMHCHGEGTEDALRESIAEEPEHAVLHDWQAEGSKFNVKQPPESRLPEAPLRVGFGGFHLPHAVECISKAAGRQATSVPRRARDFALVAEVPRVFTGHVSANIALRLSNAPQLNLPRQINARRLFEEPAIWAKVGLLPAGVRRTISATAGHVVLSVSLPRAFELVSDIFGDSEIAIERTSSTGRTEAMAEAAGGLDDLSATLAGQTALHVVRRLTPERTEAVARRVAEHVDVPDVGAVANAVREALAAEDVHVLARPPDRPIDELKPPGVGRPSVLGVLARMVRAGMVLRGARVSCAVCGCDDYYALGDIDDHTTCSVCRKQFPLPVWDGQHETRWRYRLSPVYYPLIDQGMYAVILALAWRSNECRDIFEWQSEILLPHRSDGIGEIDVAYIADGKFGFGECKMGTDLTPQRVEQCVALASTTRADELLFATATSFTAEVREALEKARDDVRTVHVLEAADLLGAEPEA